MSTLWEKAAHLIRQKKYGDLLRNSMKFAVLHVVNIRWYVSGRSKMFNTMKNDSRFQVSDALLHNLLNGCPVKKYELSRIRLCDIKRQWHNQIMSLNETATYAYIINGDEERYCSYVRTVNEDSGVKDTHILADIVEKDLARIPNTIASITSEGYDIRRGAVVIDDHDIILDGIHRSCILWKKYGPKHEIPVLRIYYSS